VKTRLVLDSNTIIVEDQSKISQIKNKLKIMKRFSDKDYYDYIVRQNLVRKLELNDYYWQRLTREIFTKIKDYSFVIVKGLPFDDNDRFSIGISSIIGMPIEPYATADTHMVRKQTPGEVVYDQDIYPHTDGAHWPHPNDFTALQCVQVDQLAGGHSRITPIDLVMEKIKEEGYSKMVGNF